MTKDEFRLGVQDMLADMANNDGDYRALLSDITSFADEIREFDPIMADKVVSFASALQGLGEYVVLRGKDIKGSH